MYLELLLWFVVPLSKAKQANAICHMFACPAIARGVSIAAAAAAAMQLQIMLYRNDFSQENGSCVSHSPSCQHTGMAVSSHVRREHC